ncbi:MAG: Smr/MutS family protein [Hyphomicrobiales bacterium]|nr:Smr/MutS family protein [Hyphomicrobiales bacterium]
MNRNLTRRAQGRLTDEDLRLWAEVARSAKPLKGKTAPKIVQEPAPTLSKTERGAAEPDRETYRHRRAQTLATVAGTTQPPLETLERRLLQRLRRRRAAPGAVLDLHGLRQDEARRRLSAFLHDCQAKGRKTAIVITGKGVTTPVLAGERGVLRRAVPLWLAMPDFRRLVIGFDEAGPGLGGAGALILRIRAVRPST